MIYLDYTAINSVLYMYVQWAKWTINFRSQISTTDKKSFNVVKIIVYIIEQANCLQGIDETNIDVSQRQIWRLGRKTQGTRQCFKNNTCLNEYTIVKWYIVGESHLTLIKKWSGVVKCYGLTKDPSDGNYMLVIQQMNMDLRKYLQQNHHNLTWKKRIDITFYIIKALSQIHNENVIHRDLHSVVNGMRPRKVTGTPLEYKNLMKQCWDADPTKRPDINYLYNKIFEMKKLYHQHDRNENNEQQQTNNNNIQILVTSNNYTSDISINSLDKNFSKSENLSEIRSVTEGHSQHNLGIPISVIIENVEYEKNEEEYPIVHLANSNYKHFKNLESLSFLALVSLSFVFYLG
ncbi:kinase-like domain-containing protein [Rhizophagus clarus]|uniref:Kinase-like domain-containing protein n=1 Tax=Rhizophagus clarus TaxID=94130 RepID=A0A8H3LTJ9_9GLOM|nr:kinase-like domain-containing protein [Rhizophagus clarus]